MKVFDPFARAVFVLLLALSGFWGIWVSAQESPGEARISDLEIRLANQQLFASFRLDGAFDESFERRIESGLPTDLVFELSLEKDRRTWFDQSVASGRLKVIAMYNAVTGEYLINFWRDGDLTHSRVVRDADELRRAMTEFSDLPAFEVEGRDPEERLRLRVRAELGTRTLLAFIPRTLHTSWAESRRFRLGDADG
ncbi:MAG: DUF4390 domain-containing protein [Acidobacteriota bacterium]